MDKRKLPIAFYLVLVRSYIIGERPGRKKGDFAVILSVINNVTTDIIYTHCQVSFTLDYHA